MKKQTEEFKQIHIKEIVRVFCSMFWQFGDYFTAGEIIYFLSDI